MHLYSYINKIIKLFEDKNVTPSNFSHNDELEQIIKPETESELEPELEQISELEFKLKSSFEENIPEIVKKRRQKRLDEES